MTTEEGARIIEQEREIKDLKLQVEALKQERDKYKEVLQKMKQCKGENEDAQIQQNRNHI